VSGAAGGLPGTTVGWGFTLTDTSTSNWIVLNDSTFIGSPVYGSYTDYVSSMFYVAGPSSTLQVSWNKALLSGTGEFDIFATDPAGAVTPGTINVDYSVFSQDPNSPTFDPSSLVTSGTFSDPVQIEVTPEPASWTLLIAAALLSAMLPGWRRRAGYCRGVLASCSFAQARPGFNWSDRAMERYASAFRLSLRSAMPRHRYASARLGSSCIALSKSRKARSNPPPIPGGR
jgi:hypothetical protein